MTPRKSLGFSENDVYFLRRAYLAAQTGSTDPSTQNGAVLVDPTDAIIRPCHQAVKAEGSNHFPMRVLNTEERWQRPLKYSYVEHAERDVIYTAARLGIPTNGMTLYVPWYSCTDCARAIIEAGIARVVGHWEMYEQTPDRWKESVQIGLDMLAEANVRTDYISQQLGMQIRFNESLWIG